MRAPKVEKAEEIKMERRFLRVTARDERQKSGFTSPSKDKAIIFVRSVPQQVWVDHVPMMEALHARKSPSIA